MTSNIDTPAQSEGTLAPDFSRDVIESDIPRDVLEILLADRTTGKHILWMTDGYEHLESIFDAKDAGHLTFAAAQMGAEVIPGLLESIRKATTEQREYGKGIRNRAKNGRKPTGNLIP